MFTASIAVSRNLIGLESVDEVAWGRWGIFSAYELTRLLGSGGLLGVPGGGRMRFESLSAHWWNSSATSPYGDRLSGGIKRCRFGGDSGSM